MIIRYNKVYCNYWCENMPLPRRLVILSNETLHFRAMSAFDCRRSQIVPPRDVTALQCQKACDSCHSIATGSAEIHSLLNLKRGQSQQYHSKLQRSFFNSNHRSSSQPLQQCVNVLGTKQNCFILRKKNQWSSKLYQSRQYGRRLTIT